MKNDKNMNIIHIADCLRGGGVQNFLLSLLPEQVKLGHKVTLIVVERNTYDYCDKLEQKLKEHGVQVVNLGKERGNKISFLKTLFACRKTIKSIKPNVVNTHGGMSHLYGTFSTEFTHCLHVLTIHNAPEYWNVPNNLLNSNKPLIYCSDAAYDMRVQHNKNIVAINNGVSADLICTKEIVDLRKELHLAKTDKIVVLVGSLRPQKNYEFLKQVVEKLQDSSIHFCISGGNYGAGYVNTSVFDDYPTIHCLGLRSDVSAIENGSDLFLSCATFEGLPIAVLEAFFNGIPCVLSPIEQHKRIVDGVGACIIPKDFTAEAFAESILSGLDNHISHDNIARNRSKAIDKFSISYAAKKYVDFYQKNLGNEKK